MLQTIVPAGDGHWLSEPGLATADDLALSSVILKKKNEKNRRFRSELLLLPLMINCAADQPLIRPPFILFLHAPPIRTFRCPDHLASSNNNNRTTAQRNNNSNCYSDREPVECRSPTAVPYIPPFSLLGAMLSPVNIGRYNHTFGKWVYARELAHRRAYMLFFLFSVLR